MQAYDLIMLIVLAMATIFGAIKGFAWQVASLASVVVSYIVAYRYRMDVAEMIQAQPPWNQFLAMLILYVGTSFVIWVAFRLFSGMIDRVRLKEFDRHLGAAFGLAKGMIYCLLITMFAMSLLGSTQQEAICQSRSGYYIAVALDRGVGILPKEIHDVVGPYLARLDDKLSGTHGSVSPEGASSTAASAPQGFDLGQTLNGLPSISESLGNTLQGGVSQGVSNALQNGASSLGFESGSGAIPSLPPAGFPTSGFPASQPQVSASQRVVPANQGVVPANQQVNQQGGSGGVLPPARFNQPSNFNTANQSQFGAQNQPPFGSANGGNGGGVFPGGGYPALPSENTLRPVQQSAQQQPGVLPR